MKEWVKSLKLDSKALFLLHFSPLRKDCPNQNERTVTSKTSQTFFFINLLHCLNVETKFINLGRFVKEEQDCQVFPASSKERERERERSNSS